MGKWKILAMGLSFLAHPLMAQPVEQLPHLNAVLMTGVSLRQEMTVASGTIEDCKNTYSSSDLNLHQCKVSNAYLLVSGDPAQSMYLPLTQVYVKQLSFPDEGDLTEYIFKGQLETVSFKVPLDVPVTLSLRYWNREPGKIKGWLQLAEGGPQNYVQAVPAPIQPPVDSARQ